MPAIEAQLEFALSFVKKIQCQDVRSVAVSSAATTEFNDHKDAVMELLTFSGNCNSWYALHLSLASARLLSNISFRYKGGTANGRIVGPWPGSVNHFLESLQEPRLQDFEFTYDSPNRFAYLGSGLSQRERRKEPLGWYIRG